jgi:hypothetical protein
MYGKEKMRLTSAINAYSKQHDKDPVYDIADVVEVAKVPGGLYTAYAALDALSARHSADADKLKNSKEKRPGDDGEVARLNDIASLYKASKDTLKLDRDAFLAFEFKWPHDEVDCELKKAYDAPEGVIVPRNGGDDMFHVTDLGLTTRQQVKVEEWGNLKGTEIWDGDYAAHASHSGETMGRVRIDYLDELMDVAYGRGARPKILPAGLDVKWDARNEALRIAQESTERSEAHKAEQHARAELAAAQAEREKRDAELAAAQAEREKREAEVASAKLKREAELAELGKVLRTSTFPSLSPDTDDAADDDDVTITMRDGTKVITFSIKVRIDGAIVQRTFEWRERLSDGKVNGQVVTKTIGKQAHFRDTMRLAHVKRFVDDLCDTRGIAMSEAVSSSGGVTWIVRDLAFFVLYIADPVAANKRKSLLLRTPSGEAMTPEALSNKVGDMTLALSDALGVPVDKFAIVPVPPEEWQSVPDTNGFAIVASGMVGDKAVVKIVKSEEGVPIANAIDAWSTNTIEFKGDRTMLGFWFGRDVDGADMESALEFAKSKLAGQPGVVFEGDGYDAFLVSRDVVRKTLWHVFCETGCLPSVCNTKAMWEM